MSDTKIERSICLAIEIIADKKISQANFDKSIKAVILLCIDRTIGNYRVKYQDSTFLANATSSLISYNKGQLVWVLIPGNDWDRTKTILCGVESSATMYKEIPMAGDLYNTIGGNLAEVGDNLGLSSYYDLTIIVYDILSENNKINIDQLAAKRYITQGNGLALGMIIQTKLAPGQQIAGDYGVRVVLKFKDSKGDAAVRDYVVNSTDVIGYPYGLIEPTLVERFIESVDTENFESIQRVLIYCNDFPQDLSKKDIKDILITDIKINGATALTELELSGYSLHIDYSQDGNVLSNSKSIVTLEAQLKSGGKIIKDKVEYYWFRLNGLIFRGSDKYSGFAGDGWECLNYYSNNTPVAAGDTFNFTSKSDNINATTVLAVERDTKIKCVAVYDKRERVTGLSHVYNQLVNNNIYIESSDLIEGNNKVDYYLDAGRPILTCIAKDREGNLLTNINYTWSVTPARGSAVQKPNTDDLNEQYSETKAVWDETKAYVLRLAAADLLLYIQTNTYKTAKQNWLDIEYTLRIENNKYYYFPISSITDYSKVSCAIEQEDGTYLGTASIVLYNHPQTEGTYNLNIENGTQVFQYDGKGNSPASKQLDRALEILPLTFTLLDNTGTLISYLQIINNGYVKWLIPGANTLLSSINNGDPDVEYGSTIAIGTDLTFAATYDIYNNRQSFNYTIDDIYDSKKTNNYIRLNVKYKDIILDAYTDFTFPKDGDPGTNGTDYVAKISPSNDTDRVYISNRAISSPFDDRGNAVDKLNFSLYNNSKKIDGIADNSIVWTCPPGNKTGNTYLSTVANGRPKAKVNSATTVTQALTNIRSDKPVDIVRASYLNGDIQQYAEYPICYNYVNDDYRIKVKPKTGFKYAVYQEDGTAPEYDNTLPFEIIVEKRELNTGYYQTGLANLIYDWYAIGNIELDNDKNASLQSNQKYYKPKNTFDGLDLTSAIVVKVAQNNTDIGLIHIPVYMIINRYNHQALNGWDGNSIDLGNTNGDTILAPQIGAGKKLTDNSFTGVFMGDVKNNSGKEEIGLMGYLSGLRSIFLDALTGNATFGKNRAGQIKIDARANLGTIQSGDYNYKTTDHTGTGMKIKFSSTGSGTEQGPYIRFGSNRFSVDTNGNIHAAGGGDIAGWRIDDDALYKHDGTNKTGMRSNGDPAFYAGTNDQNSTNSTSTNAYNFFVNHDGYLYSKSGKIAKWSINADALTDGDVGMGLGQTIAANTFNNQNSVISPRIWSNNSFAVTADGKIWANNGQIGPWAITKNLLTDGNTGLGTKTISAANMNSAFGVNAAKAARIWSLETNGTDSTANFVVTNTGEMYSKTGKIGGWTIGSSTLTGGNTTINSNGSISNANGGNGTWAIYNDGHATFTNINASGGYIGGWQITTNQLKGGSVILDKDGSLEGPNWSIDKYGNAEFNRIHGIIASSTGSVALTNSNGTFSVGSNGNCSFGSGSKALTYDSGSGLLSLGNWEIEGNFILNKTGNTKIHATLVITGGFSCVSSGGTQNPGVSGTVTFSDGSSLTIMGGIITGVGAGEGAEWD